jgi:hypothetical protein
VPDVNDIIAVEAHRQLVAVQGGASIRAVKAERSIWKEIAKRYVEEDQPEAYTEFTEKLKTTKMPLRNFGATAQDAEQASEPEVKPLTPEEESAELERLLAESIENELKVTRTATGAPKVDEYGNVVQPLQAATPEAEATSKRDQKQRESDREREEKAEAAKAEREKNKPQPTQQPATVVVKDTK